MERNITFNCMFLECGRKFNTEDLLEDHVKRRHPDYYKDRYAYKFKENSETQKKKSNKLLNELETKIKEIEDNTILLNENDGENEIDLTIPNMENLELDHEDAENKEELEEDNNDVISDEMLLIGGKFFQYEDVDEIELEDRALKEFKNDQDIDFTELTNVLSINLSKNLLRSLDDLKFFSKLLILDISKNQIEDIFFVEELPSLNILYAENNKISAISSLVKCKYLEKLYLANNTIKYHMSSLKTLNSLQKLSELTIKNNTFLENTIGYKYMIIRKCRKLAKLDNEEITVVDRDVAKSYENMNNSEMRPNTSVGVANYSNKIEVLFPSEAQENFDVNFDENLKNEVEEIKVNKEAEAKINEITEEVDTKLTLNVEKIENEIKNCKANNEIVNDNFNKINDKPSVDNKKKVLKTQTISNFSVKDKVISQVEYIPKSNLARNNKKAIEDPKLNKKPNSKITTKNSEIKEKSQAKPQTEAENDPVMRLSKINLKENPYKKIDLLEKEIAELKNKNSKMIEEKKNNEVSVNLLKSQLENVEKLNKEYEEMIESLKLQLEREKQVSKNVLEEKSNLAYQEKDLVSTDDEEKKDYYDLLYEYSNSKVEAKAAKVGMTSMEFVESQRPKSAIKKPACDEYDKTVKELKDLRESQINFFTRKNDLDEDISLERESDNNKIIGDLLKEETEEQEEVNNNEDPDNEEENVELNHSSNFVNKSIKLNGNQLKTNSNNLKQKNDLIEFEEDEDASEGSDLDSIEELFRISCMGLKELTSEIQTLNQQKNQEPNNSQMRTERSRSKNPKRGEKSEANPYIQNPNLNKLNRLKSKEKILINEEVIRNIASKKPSSAEQLIKEAEKEKNKTTQMPIISDKVLKKPIILPSAAGALGKIGGPKLIIKKDSEQNSFTSNNNNSLIIEENNQKKSNNKIIFKQTRIGSNTLRLIENRISPNSTLSSMKQNLNLNPSNNSINSGKVDFKGKINLSNFNNTETETDKTNNTSFNTQNSSNNKNINFDFENILNSSNNNNNTNYNPNSIFKNLNASHLKSNSTLSGDSANLLLANLAANGKNKDSNYISNSIINNNKINFNKENFGAEPANLNSDRRAFSKNLVEGDKVLINNKINDVSNMRNNLSLKKPAIMGAAYGNIGNSKPLLKTKTEGSSNKKQEENK